MNLLYILQYVLYVLQYIFIQFGEKNSFYVTYNILAIRDVYVYVSHVDHLEYF